MMFGFRSDRQLLLTLHPQPLLGYSFVGDLAFGWALSYIFADVTFALIQCTAGLPHQLQAFICQINMVGLVQGANFSLTVCKKSI